MSTDCTEDIPHEFFRLHGDRLVLSGEIDTMAAEAWPWSPSELPQISCIDARAVTFLDVRGLGLLLRLARAADPAVLQLWVTGMSVPRLLDLTHLAYFFKVTVH